MKYPLIEGTETHHPRDGTCLSCGKKTGGAFVALNGGALLRIGKSNSAAPNENLWSFLSIIDHGVTKSGKPVRIVENEGYGQFEFYFCSTDCLRSFFSGLVDDFERQRP